MTGGIRRCREFLRDRSGTGRSGTDDGKAIRTIRECDMVAVVVSDASLKAPEVEAAGEAARYPEYLKRCVAYQIALPMVPEMEEKAKLYLPMPMIKEKKS